MSEQPLISFESQGAMIVGTINSPSVLDQGDISRFGSEIMDYVTSHPGVNLLLNFEQVHFLSSTVVNELLRVHNAVRSLQGTLRLCALNRNVHALFKLTGFDRTFDIVGSL